MYHLALQGSYTTFELGLFCNDQHIETVSDELRTMSSALIPYLDALLARHHLTLRNISFITVNHGPGSFTSLRVLLATLHGITFTKQIPLVAVNGLEALAHAARKTYPDHLIVSMLNAYSGDVHIAAYQDNNILLAPQCLPIRDALLSITNLNKSSYIFTGNGVTHYQTEIVTHGFLVAEPVRNEAPLAILAELGHLRWQNHQKSFFVHPLYLKIHSYTPKYS